MKINSISKQQNFKGNLGEKAVKFITEKPVLLAGLAGSSVIAQKVVMSASEATIGPAMDMAIGKTITKVTDEKDGRTNKSSKVQAVRTFSQAVGGTIVGVIVRGLCIAAATAACAKLGEKAGKAIGNSLSDRIANEVNSKGSGFIDSKNLYEASQNAAAWGKNIGGAVALLVMLVTNFVIDAPLINWINKKAMNFVKGAHNKAQKTSQENQAKEVK